jgi:hypothetical protein
VKDCAAGFPSLESRVGSTSATLRKMASIWRLRLWMRSLMAVSSKSSGMADGNQRG